MLVQNAYAGTRNKKNGVYINRLFVNVNSNKEERKTIK